MCRNERTPSKFQLGQQLTFLDNILKTTLTNMEDIKKISKYVPIITKDVKTVPSAAMSNLDFNLSIQKNAFNFLENRIKQWPIN